MKKLFSFLLALTMAVCFSKIALAAEHPGEHQGTKTPAEQKEHPGKTHAQEHPGEGAEHPGKKSLLSADQIIKGIKDHINKMTVAGGGYYLLRDEQEGKDLKLKLIKVHEDKVSYIKKEDAYFACTDFISDDGKTIYDVDFWMRKNNKGELEVYKTKVHKKDGTPRFIYKDDEIAEVK